MSAGRFGTGNKHGNEFIIFGHKWGQFAFWKPSPFINQFEANEGFPKFFETNFHFMDKILP